MKESKNIERLFQEKFRDFEVSPPERLWQNIEQKANHSSIKNQRSYWIWLSGIAVGLLLLFTLNNPFVSNNIDILPTLFEKNISFEEQEVVPSVLDNTTNNIIEHKVNAVQPLKSTIVKTQLNTSSLKQNKVRFKLTKKLDELVYDDDKEPFWVSTNELPVLFIQEIEEDASINQFVKSKEINRWSISTIAAPIFLGGFQNNTNPEEKTENQHAQKGKVSLSYGVQFAYQLSKRLSLQSGIHRVDFAYNDADIAQIDDELLMKTSNVNSLGIQNPETPTINTELGSKVTQVYGYVEIPLEAKYRLNNEGNFGVNLVGGFSTLLLNRNELYVETSTGIFEEPGKKNKFNELNFSGNLGVELEYKIYKNVNFNLVPMFKVQTHTLNSENSPYTPYSLGLYSGLNLRF